jgi:hypothetical protein
MAIGQWLIIITFKFIHCIYYILVYTIYYIYYYTLLLYSYKLSYIDTGMDAERGDKPASELGLDFAEGLGSTASLFFRVSNQMYMTETNVLNAYQYSKQVP